MNAQTSTCPTENMLAAYGLGKLDPSNSDIVGRHLTNCIECRRIVGTVPTDDFLGRLRDVAVPSACDADSDFFRTQHAALPAADSEPKNGAPEPDKIGRYLIQS